MRYDIFGINRSLDVTPCMADRDGMANNAVADDSQFMGEGVYDLELCV